MGSSDVAQQRRHRVGWMHSRRPLTWVVVACVLLTTCDANRKRVSRDLHREPYADSPLDGRRDSERPEDNKRGGGRKKESGRKEDAAADDAAEESGARMVKFQPNAKSILNMIRQGAHRSEEAGEAAEKLREAGEAAAAWVDLEKLARGRDRKEEGRPGRKKSEEGREGRKKKKKKKEDRGGRKVRFGDQLDDEDDRDDYADEEDDVVGELKDIGRGRGRGQVGAISQYGGRGDNAGKSGYPGKSQYGGRSGYPGKSQYGGKSGYPGKSEYGGKSGYPGKSEYGGKSGYPGKSEYGDKSGYPGKSQYGGKSGYPGKSEYGGKSGYPGKSEYGGKSGYPGKSEYGGKSGYPGKSEYGGKSGYPGKSQYGGKSGYPGKSQYGGISGYPGKSQFAGGKSGFQGARGTGRGVTGSCLGRCDAEYDPSKACQCSPRCQIFKNCCTDYHHRCIKSHRADNNTYQVLSYNICWGCMEGDKSDGTGMKSDLARICTQDTGSPGTHGKNGMGLNITRCASNTGEAIAKYHADAGGYDLMAFQEASNFWDLGLPARGVRMRQVQFGAELPFNATKGIHRGEPKMAWIVSMYDHQRFGVHSLKVTGVEKSDSGRPYLILIFDNHKLMFINLHNCQPGWMFNQRKSWNHFPEDMEESLHDAFGQKPERKRYRVILSGDLNDLNGKLPGSIELPWNSNRLHLQQPLAKTCCNTKLKEKANLMPGDYIFDSASSPRNRVPRLHTQVQAQSDHLPVEAVLRA